MRDAGYEPLEPYQSLKHKWRCTHRNCGREVTPTLGQILRGQGGCKFCARVYVDPAAAVEVMRHAGYEPLEPYVNSSHRWRCRCVQCGRETFPRYDEARIGSRCVYCARKKLDPTDAVKLMKDAGFEPLEAYPGSMDPWECRHSCGRIVRPRYAHIQQGRRGCEYCSRQSMADQFRWTDDEAYAFIEELGYTPIVPYPGRNNAPWLMKHRECGREVTPRLAGLQQGQGDANPATKTDSQSAIRLPKTSPSHDYAQQDSNRSNHTPAKTTHHGGQSTHAGKYQAQLSRISSPGVRVSGAPRNEWTHSKLKRSGENKDWSHSSRMAPLIGHGSVVTSHAAEKSHQHGTRCEEAQDHASSVQTTALIDQRLGSCI